MQEAWSPALHRVLDWVLRAGARCPCPRVLRVRVCESAREKSRDSQAGVPAAGDLSSGVADRKGSPELMTWGPGSAAGWRCRLVHRWSTGGVCKPAVGDRCGTGVGQVVGDREAPLLLVVVI